MAAAMFLSLPLILRDTIVEHRKLKKIIYRYNIQGIISDNRFGLWSKCVPCVYISHQVHIKAPRWLKFTEPLLHYLHYRFIRKFNQLWIPDNETLPWLSGNLGHPASHKVRHSFIGPLSRFSGSDRTGFASSSSDFSDPAEILVLISGPEPQRSIFENLIKTQAAGFHKKIVILQGIPESDQKPKIAGNPDIYPHMPTSQLQQMIKNAGIVVCRSGYSTIMDLAALGKKVFFVPTPGQTEQEYLAAYMKKQGIADFARQADFQLKNVLISKNEFTGFSRFPETNALEEAIRNFIEDICNKHENLRFYSAEK